MTLTDPEASYKMQQHEKKPMKVGEALREVLWQALEQKRLTCGGFACAKLLEMDPFNVMFCLLPVDSRHDVDVHIQHTLIEAFCLENDIKLLKVDSSEKLAKALTAKFKLPINDNDLAPGRKRADVSCVIIQYPEVTSSDEEQLVSDYFKAHGKLGNACVAMPS